jgi:ADP-heptose:LPS heptosyltransferase
MNILIVRLGALGDIIHAVPAAAALRTAFPDARIDWLVDARYRSVVDLVTAVDCPLVLERPTIFGWADAARRMRQVRYDAAIDLQGLLKSAVLARASGAPRVVGFSIWHLREKTARPFYSATDDGQGSRPEVTRSDPDDPGEPRIDADRIHVIHKNLRLLRTLGVHDERINFPLAHVDSDALRQVRAVVGNDPFALINPGAGWPNKRWPPDRFGEVALFLREVRNLPSFVLWGPGEEVLAGEVVAASAGSARVAPPTTPADVLALARAASLMVSGDTGPLHIAAAAGTPVVSIFGPTDPDRNGPWSDADITVSRFSSCGCRYERRCRQSSWCLAGVTVAEVTAAVQQRLGTVRIPSSSEASADHQPSGGGGDSNRHV